MELNFNKKMDILESIAEGLYYDKDAQIIDKLMKFINNPVDGFKEEFIKAHYRGDRRDDEIFAQCVQCYIDSYKSFWDELQEINNNSSKDATNIENKKEMELPF